MTEKIGKYRIIERIGRGGMGTVFKAHDPILDRLVALKVISGEVDVNEELKARFYREAQAGAKLNHPNVITVHDLGEDQDRLFIVMEFLDGEELKGIIAQRRELPLEDKLSLMIQVCDGLHYAHQKGVIHRDIKPGNIFVLRNGQAKILDFGIARLATAQDGLTRTGLIMGTLRYMSPEQARGRVDHRSDIFSVGSVFYELLVYRPAFDRENPIEILEALRSENPPPLTDVDSSIPQELATIIERALRKDPAQRFQDLGQMRGQIESVRRQLTGERERVQAEVRARLGELRELQAAVRERLGTSPEDETLVMVDDRARLSHLRALERDLAAQIEHLRARLAAATAVEPHLARGFELVQAGQAEAAISEFEQVLHEIPQHPRALEGLRQARGAREAQREEKATPAARAAEPREREVRRQAEDAATLALEAMDAARRAAEAAEAGRYALSLWRDGEAKADEGRAALAQAAHARARERFVEATDAYRRAADSARGAVEAIRRVRAEVERTRDEAMSARGAAEEAGAATYAAVGWTAAQEKERGGREALDREDFTAARELFRSAAQEYRDAAHAAAEAEAREAQREEAARTALAEARRLIAEGRPDRAREALSRLRTMAPAHPELAALEAQAQRAVEALQRARAEGERVRALLDQTRKAMARGELAPALALAEEAVDLAPNDARALRLRDDLREQLAQARAVDRPAPPAEAPPAAAAGQVAGPATRLETARPEPAARPVAITPARPKAAWTFAPRQMAIAAVALVAVAVGIVLALLPRSESPVTPTPEKPIEQPIEKPPDKPIDQPQRPQPSPDEATARELLQKMTAVRAQGMKLEAERRVPAAWAAAVAKQKDGDAALAAKDFARAVAAYRESQQRYQEAADQARKVADKEGLDQLRDQVAKARLAAEQVKADSYPDAAKLLAEAQKRQADGEAAATRQDVEGARAAFGDAEKRYRVAEAIALKQTSVDVRAEAARKKMADARTAAEKLDARRLAARTWNDAAARDADGDKALKARDYAGAQTRFAEAEALYRRAEEEAGKALALKGDAEQIERLASEARELADKAEAKRLAPQLWASAAAKESEGKQAMGRPDYPAAQARYREAQQEYQRAATEGAAGLKAEQARGLMGQARDLADKADAKRFAAQLWTSAAAKDTAGQGEFTKRSYAAALARFGEAQQEYQRAREVAAVEAKKAIEAARGTAESRREEARKGEAEELARDLFTSARAKETEADGLAGRLVVAAAIQAYQDATQGYRTALQQAGVRRQERAEADAAKARMLADKQKARPDAPDFKAGVAEEQRGNDAYRLLAFKDATGRFGAAQGLFAKATAPVLDPRDPKGQIQAMLNTFKRAIETKDLAEYQKIRPNLSPVQLRRLRESFERDNSQRHTVEFTDLNIDVRGNEAEVKGLLKDIRVLAGGQTIRNEDPFVYKVKRSSSGWVIEESLQ